MNYTFNFESKTEKLPAMPNSIDCNAELDKKEQKLDDLQESACEHKNFEIHGLQKESIRLRPELETNYDGDEAQPLTDRQLHE